MRIRLALNYVVITSVALFLAIGCSDMGDKSPTAPDNGNTETTWNNTIGQLFQQNCVSCHSPSLRNGGLSLSSFNDAMQGGNSGAVIVPNNPDGSKLFRLIAGQEEPRMPQAPLPALNANDIAKVRTWIATGAKQDTTGGGGNGGGGGNSPPTWSEDVFPMFRQDCIGCHNPSAASINGEFDLTTYDAFMRGGEHGSPVRTRNPDESRIIEMLEGSEDPRMPFNGTPWSATKIKIVLDWIIDGAQNN